MHDAAGFPDAKIVLSNQLDELVIMQIIAQVQDEAAHNRFDADAVINRLVWRGTT
jgi:nicotinate phosphoribosyltransferase